MEETLNYKILLLGESKVGKTAFMNRYVSPEYIFSENAVSTIGILLCINNLRHKC